MSEPETQHPVIAALSRDVSVGRGAREGAAWITASRLSWQAFQFAMSLVTARLLLPSEFGHAALALAVCAFAQLFTDLGLSAAVVHARRVTEPLLSTTFWLNLLTGIVLCVGISAAAVPLAHAFHQPAIAPLLALASLNFVFSCGVVQTALLERTFHFRRLAFIEAGTSIVGIVVVPVAAVLGAGAASLVIGPLTSTVLLSIALWASVPWRPHRWADRASLARLWRFSRGIVGFNSLNYWSRNLDTLLLGRVATPGQLGEYNRAYMLTTMPVGQMSMIAGRVMFPALARLRDDTHRLARAWIKGMSTASSLTLPITVGLATTAPALVPVLYGSRWNGMVTVLELLALAAMPQIVAGSTGALFRATGHTDLMFKLGLISSGLSVIAIVGGLPWKATGVAAALLIKSWIGLFVVLVPLARVVGLRLREVLFPVLASAVPTAGLAAATLAVRALAPQGTAAWELLAVQIATGVIAYLAILWRTNRTAFEMVRRHALAFRARRTAASPGARG
jgi:O-antigen/teichoic acid export membrane protein